MDLARRKEFRMSHRTSGLFLTGVKGSLLDGTPRFPLRSGSQDRKEANSGRDTKSFELVLEPACLSAHSDFVGSWVYACSGVTCHLHFWQNDRGLLRATAITRGRNGHRIRVSTQSQLWRKRASRRSCRDSNSEPFDHESGALTIELSRRP